jgi:thioredoxin-related protein
MRRIVPFLLLSLFVASQASAKTWLKKVADAQKVAKEKDQLILVDMFAEWCGWCHRFEREVFPSMVFQEATKDIILLRLDTEDGGEGTRFAREYAVTSLPTFLLLAPDLSIAGVIRGYLPPNDFVKALRDTRASHEAFVTRVKNESKLAKNDWAGRLKLAKDLSSRMAYEKAEPRFKAIIAARSVPPATRDQAYYELAVMYRFQMKHAEAAKTVQKLKTISTKGEPVERARLLLSQIYYEQGNLLGAATELRSFKTAYPNSPLIQNVDMLLPTVERRLASGK